MRPKEASSIKNFAGRHGAPPAFEADFQPAPVKDKL
jgi:hypothetical protein